MKDQEHPLVAEWHETEHVLRSVTSQEKEALAKVKQLKEDLILAKASAIYVARVVRRWKEREFKAREAARPHMKWRCHRCILMDEPCESCRPTTKTESA